MLFSIQNSYGQVYGLYGIPPTTKSPEVLAHELGIDLEDILGINGVSTSILRSVQDERREEDRIVIDIQPEYGRETAQIARVNEAVGRLATTYDVTDPGV